MSPPCACEFSTDSSLHLQFFLSCSAEALPLHYCPVDKHKLPVEFINDSWYFLTIQSSCFVIRNSQQIACVNTCGLGWWSATDPQNPERPTLPTVPISSTNTGFQYTPADSDSDQEAESENAGTFEGDEVVAIVEETLIPEQFPLPDLTPTNVSQTLPDEPPENPPSHDKPPTDPSSMMSSAPANGGSLQGVALSIFNGD